ncbi:hypothetical protein [Nodosilinea sp. LEGE 07298]|nr:hypothetical protein [Nodosilinea sp. LEGE 07298]
MTYASTLWVIPLLAIAYLLVVYGALLLLAKRASSSRRTEG